jgi:hypothetical protein
MKVFGTKQTEPTDADRAAAARLSAVAARFRTENAAELTESEPDPIGEPDVDIEEPDPEV